jgi:hypothetical protein
LDFISLLFGCLWLFGIGGSLERSWGRGRYSLFLSLVTLAPSLGILLGTQIIHDATTVSQPLLAGLWVPLAAVTVAWAAIDPYQEILFYFVLKLQARWVAWISVGIIYFESFHFQPILGFFGLGGCLLAFYWVRGRVPYSFQGMFDGIGGRRGSRTPNLKFYDVDRGKRGRDDLNGESRQRGLLGKYQAYKERKKLEKLFRDSGYGDDNDRPASHK